MPIRIATFNLENLLQRFNFYSYGQLTVERSLRILGVESDDEDYFALRRSLFVALTDDSRQQTAQVIRDTGADVICLQEVENIDVLNHFHQRFLKQSTGVNYGWRRLIEGNDNRGIDVAVMSKQRIDPPVSHAEHTFDDFDLFNAELEAYGLSPGDSIFRRDCLEVETSVDDNPLTLFICHFKSMSGGRDETIPVRRAEAAAVRRIIEDRFPNLDQADWLVVGDLNDYISDSNGNPVTPNGLEPLFEGGFSVNLVDNLPAANRWTHFYPREQSFHQLDYLLASPGLAGKNLGVQPDIVRAGQPYRIPGIEAVPRYPRVGFDRPKASDHCAVAVTLTV
jgi:endonuclease/exonuclease/phosphatase family metal-dependent hydrolase